MKHLKKIKRHHFFYHLTVWFILFFFVIISSSLIITQTQYGKNKAGEILKYIAKENGLDLSYKEIGGVLPFQCKLLDAEIITDTNIITIEHVKFRIAFISLLFKNLDFRSMTASNIKLSKIISAPVKISAPSETPWISPPINITFRSIKLNNLTLPILNSVIPLDVKGEIKVKKYGKKIAFDLKLSRKDYPNAHLNISSRAYKANKEVTTNFKLISDTTNALHPFVNLNYDLSFLVEMETKGHLDTYIALLFNTKQTNLPKLTGKIDASIFDIKTKLSENLNFFFNRKTNLTSEFYTLDDLSINLKDLYLYNDLYEISGKALFNRNYSINQAHLSIYIDELSLFNKISPVTLQGKLENNIDISKNNINSNFKIADFFIDKYHVVDFNGTMVASIKDYVIQGNIFSSAYTLNQPLSLNSNFIYSIENFFELDNLILKAPSSNGLFNLKYISKNNIVGNGHIHFDDLSQLKVFFPSLSSNGQIDVNTKIFLSEEDQKQIVDIDGNFHDFHFDNYMGENIHANILLEEPFDNLTATLKIDIKNSRLHELELNTISIDTSTESENWPFKITARGNWKDPVEFDSFGFWKYKDKEFSFNIQDISGSFFKNPFILENPVKLEFSPKEFMLSNLHINMAESSLQTNISLTKDSADIKLLLTHFPLEFLSLNPLDLDIKGFVSLDAALEKKASLKSHVDMILEDLQIKALGDEKPINASGKFNAVLKEDFFQIKSDLQLKNQPILSLEANVPILMDFIPFSIRINPHKNISSDITFNGRVEDILDFINIGPQRLEGDLKCHLTISKTLLNPHLEGSCTFKDGIYENYYTGTYLENIDGALSFDEQKIDLESLTGNDLQLGSFRASGNIELSSKKAYPFHFMIDTNNLTFVQSDILNANVDSHLEFKGTSKSSKAFGDVNIVKSIVTIPKKLPLNIPKLYETYIYDNNKKDLMQPLEPAIYPIHLDFNVALQSPIEIKGQGLDSTWNGNFKIGGTYSDILTMGALELDKGNYTFSGRKFELTKGTVTFTGKSHEMPLLDIQAKMNYQNVDIIANVKGNLNSPKLFFTSEPPLPASSIMSLLIFGKLTSELSTVQTLELANSMTNELDQNQLPDNSHSNLGLDRYNVVSSPTSNQMAMQLGNYITNGVVVTFSQGNEFGASNIIVEVDLKKGFVFQAETQQEEEQGKFTIKWQHNY